jgi:hypothetical protein
MISFRGPAATSVTNRPYRYAALVIEPTLDQRVRLSIFERLAESSRPPVVEELMAEFGLSRPDAVAAVGRLADARHIALVKGTARILMAFPFSAIATPFRVEASGREYFANCAWDAVSFHAMLDRDITIDSFCHHCGQQIHIEFSAGKATAVEPAATIVYLALRPSEWWEDIISTCSNTMVFFCSVEHRDASGLAATPDSGASLTPDEVHALGIPIYGRKLSIDYERPGRDELNAHFESLGLTGPYWKI